MIETNKRSRTRRALLLLLVAAFGVLPLMGCASTYPDMLRDRDATIRDLEGKLASARNQNSALRRSNDNLLKELETLKAKPTPTLASAPRQDDLTDMQKQLADADVRYRSGRLTIGIPNKVTFASGSTRLLSDGQKVLLKVARVLRGSKFQSKRIYVEGHTDSDPIRKTKDKYRNNRHLSVERADAVARFLIKEGRVPEDRIVIVGFGPLDPISPRQKSKNRRVEIVVGD